MELQRGCCSFCLENNKILTGSDAEEFCKFLPKILDDDFLSDEEFQKIKKYFKVCINCCFKIQFAGEMKNTLNLFKEHDTGSKNCHFCNSNQSIVKVENNWKYFIDRMGDSLKSEDFPIFTCPKCVFYFDTIFNIKTKLSLQFRLLARKKKPTSGKKRASTTPASPAKRQKTKNCFTYLEPLSKNAYKVDTKLTRDKKLYKRIAYVNLFEEKGDVKETPKKRPTIKIRFKSNTRRAEKLLTHKSNSERVQSKPRTTVRRQSMFMEKKEREEVGPDETPKVATDVKLVPKRRVSNYILNTTEFDDKEDSPSKYSTNDIDQIVDKYISPDNLGSSDNSTSDNIDEHETNEDINDDQGSDDKSEKEAIVDKTEEKEAVAATEEEATTDRTEEQMIDDKTEEDISENNSKHDGIEGEKKDDEHNDFCVGDSEKVPEITIDNIDNEKSANGVIGEKKKDESLTIDEELVQEDIVKEINLTNSNSNLVEMIENNGDHSDDNNGDFLNGSERKKKRVTFNF